MVEVCQVVHSCTKKAGIKLFVVDDVGNCIITERIDALIFAPFTTSNPTEKPLIILGWIIREKSTLGHAMLEPDNEL